MQATNVDGQQSTPTGTFPYAFSSSSPLSTQETAEWVATESANLLELMAKHGAVLLRATGAQRPEDFDQIVAALGLPNFPYRKSMSNAVRREWTERVFSANEAPPDVQIFFHHEMAQTPFYPRTILFSCLEAPETGGATPLCRSDVLFDALDKQCPEFVDDLTRFGLRYSNVMPARDDASSGMGRSWRSTLGVEHAQEAEQRLGELRYQWEWLEEEALRVTTPILPAIKTLPDGRKTFFNQLIAAYCGWKDQRNDPSRAIRLGNDKALDADAVKVAFELAEQYAFDLQWQVGDVAIVDNRLVMHARRPFNGQRRVLASLAQVEENTMDALPSSLEC